MRLLFSKPKYIVAAGVMTFALAVLASGWASTYQRLEDLRETNRQQDAVMKRIQTANQAAVYGLSYALRSEQAKAGSFEAQRDYIENALGNNKGYVDNLLSRITSLELMLEQCHATNKMLSDGWTGNTAIKPGE